MSPTGLVVAHNPLHAVEQTQDRLKRIQFLQQRANQLAGKLTAQDDDKILCGLLGFRRQGSVLP